MDCKSFGDTLRAWVCERTDGAARCATTPPAPRQSCHARSMALTHKHVTGRAATTNCASPAPFCVMSGRKRVMAALPYGQLGWCAFWLRKDEPECAPVNVRRGSAATRQSVPPEPCSIFLSLAALSGLYEWGYIKAFHYSHPENSRRRKQSDRPKRVKRMRHQNRNQPPF